MLIFTFLGFKDVSLRDPKHTTAIVKRFFVSFVKIPVLLNGNHRGNYRNSSIYKN